MLLAEWSLDQMTIKETTNKMTGILLYSHHNEPVTQVILSHAQHGANIITLSIKELLDNVIIFDEISDVVKLSWKLPCGKVISNSKDFYLINRVLDLPQDLFDDFHEDDKGYSRAEFYAYLLFALEAFPLSLSKPGPFGLSGNAYSLPRQWEMIKQETNEMLIPDYYFGAMSMCPYPQGEDSNVVYSSPNNNYCWKPNKYEDNADSASFAFIKPKGVPVVCFMHGKEAKVFPFDAKETLSSEQEDLIKKNAHILNKIFKYKIAESLLFIDKDVVSFGMISPLPHASRHKDWFNEAIISTMKKEMGNE